MKKKCEFCKEVLTDNELKNTNRFYLCCDRLRCTEREAIKTEKFFKANINFKQWNNKSKN